MKLNCDLGEGYDRADDAIMPLIDQASIACGGHAGSDESMSRCVALAKRFDVDVGAHPSYPDTENFGRLSIDISRSELKQSLKNQIQALYQHCLVHSIALSYVKPHGALYNDAAKNLAVFGTVVEAVSEFCNEHQLTRLALMVPGGLSQQHILKSEQEELALIYEGFIDRAYCDDGTLVSRSESGAVHENIALVLKQVKQFAQQGGVTSKSGSWISMHVDSLCVHGDTPNAIELVKVVRSYLVESNELHH